MTEEEETAAAIHIKLMDNVREVIRDEIIRVLNETPILKAAIYTDPAVAEAMVQQICNRTDLAAKLINKIGDKLIYVR